MQEQSGVAAALWRRRRLLPVGVLLTAALCLSAFWVMSAQYLVSARVLLVPAVSESEDGGSNPYLNLGGLEPAASVLASTVTAAESARELERRGVTGAFDVYRDPFTGGPVLLVEVQDDSPSAALTGLGLVLDQLPITLDRLQDEVGVAPLSRSASTIISRDQRAAVVRKSQTRAVVVAAVVGIAGTILSLSLLDAFLLRRKARTPVVPPGEPPRVRRSYKPVHLGRDRRSAEAPAVTATSQTEVPP